MSENETPRQSSFYGIAYLVIFGIGMASIPVQQWFEYAIRCTGENPLTPLNPAIVSGVLKTFFHATLVLLASHFLIFNRTIPIKTKYFGGLVCVFLIYLVASQYLSEHRSIEWSLLADTANQSNNQWWCEHR